MQTKMSGPVLWVREHPHKSQVSREHCIVALIKSFTSTVSSFDVVGDCLFKHCKSFSFLHYGIGAESRVLGKR